jgi:hypothetical protein
MCPFICLPVGLIDLFDKFIARHLLLNNEGKRWVDPSEYPSSPDGVLTARFQTQDNEIFAFARLINCVQFKNIVSEDFLKLLIGLPSVGKSANLDILMVIPLLSRRSKLILFGI